MYIAIDVGGTNIRITGSNSLEKPYFSDIRKIKINNDYYENLKILKNTADEFGKNIEGVAVGLPIIFTDKEKTTGEFANLKDWSLKPIKKDFEKIFKTKIFLENDAVLAALGEAYYGNGVGKNFIYLIWGTGVGGTEIKNSNGNIQDFPFEPGHKIIIEKNGRAGSCSHNGDLESYVGGSSIEKYYGKPAADLLEEEWEEVINFFTEGISKILNERKTDLIIFGGGVAINQLDKINRIQNKLNEKLGNESPKLILSKLGDNAGLYGALAIMKNGGEKNRLIKKAN